MSVSEAARELKVTRKTIYRWIEEGRLDVERFPYKRHGSVRVLMPSVERLKGGG